MVTNQIAKDNDKNIHAGLRRVHRQVFIYYDRISIKTAESNLNL